MLARRQADVRRLDDSTTELRNHVKVDLQRVRDEVESMSDLRLS